MQSTNKPTVYFEKYQRLHLDIYGVHENVKRFTMKHVRSVENLSSPVKVIRESDWMKYRHIYGIPFNEILGPMTISERRIIRSPEK